MIVTVIINWQTITSTSATIGAPGGQPGWSVRRGVVEVSGDYGSSRRSGWFPAAHRRAEGRAEVRALSLESVSSGGRTYRVASSTHPVAAARVLLGQLLAVDLRARRRT